jgi:hypothetical protein
MIKYMLVCDVCERPLRTGYGDLAMLDTAERIRALAAKLKWKRVAKTRAVDGKSPVPGYDLCARCTHTEGRREGL